MDKDIIIKVEDKDILLSEIDDIIFNEDIQYWYRMTAFTAVIDKIEEQAKLRDESLQTLISQEKLIKEQAEEIKNRDKYIAETDQLIEDLREEREDYIILLNAAKEALAQRDEEIKRLKEELYKANEWVNELIDLRPDN